MEHRLRIPNFSKSEVALLEELVLSGSSTLVKAVSNAAGWEAKKNAWKKLAIQFNAQNSYFRSAATLRKKWDNRKIKQKLAQRVNNTHTGGTPSERNCDRVKGECTTELLNTPETEPESMFDCDADSGMEHRLRIPNFSESEVALLEDLVSRGSSILVKGVSNAAGWEAKQIAWRKLAIQFNAQNSYFRSSATLRKKWDNRKMKKKLAQRENNTHLRGTTPESNCDRVKRKCTTELLNTPEAGPESMFDCDGDSKDDTNMIEAPFTVELDPLGSEKEDSQAKSVANPIPMGRIRRLRWKSSKHSEIVNNNCHDYSPTLRRAPSQSPVITENKRRIKIPLTIKGKWRTLADIKIKLMAARLRHEREEHLLKTEALKAKRREEEKEHMLRVEEARFRRRCLEVQHQESHQEHIRRMEKLKRED